MDTGSRVGGVRNLLHIFWLFVAGPAVSMILFFCPSGPPVDCTLFHTCGTFENDLDKWEEIVFKVRRAKEMDIAPLPGVMEIEMKYGNNIMRTRVRR